MAVQAGRRLASQLHRAFRLSRDPSKTVVQHKGDALNGESFATLQGNQWLQVRKRYERGTSSGFPVKETARFVG